MGRATHRPTAVTFAGIVAGFGGFWTLVTTGPALFIAVATGDGGLLAVATAISLFAIVRMLLSGVLLQMYTWARPVGMLILGLAAAIQLFAIVTAASGSIVGFVANSGAVAALAMSGEAFNSGTERADVSEQQATKIGTGSR